VVVHRFPDGLMHCLSVFPRACGIRRVSVHTCRCSVAAPAAHDAPVLQACSLVHCSAAPPLDHAQDDLLGWARYMGSLGWMCEQLAAGGGTVPSPADSGTDAGGSSNSTNSTAADMTLYDFISGTEELSILKSLVDSAGMEFVQLLDSSSANLTLFAPVNEASVATCSCYDGVRARVCMQTQPCGA
jgi:hypothetical protein